MADLRHSGSLKPMRAEYMGSGRLKLLGGHATKYRDVVRFTGADHKEAVTVLSPGDIVFVKYKTASAKSNRLGEPRVGWVNKRMGSVK